MHVRIFNYFFLIPISAGYGQTGPLAKAAGHDINYVARAGVFDMMPPSTLSPLPVQVADLMGGSWPAALQIGTSTPLSPTYTLFLLLYFIAFGAVA